MADLQAADGLKRLKSEIFANLRRARDSLEKLAESSPDSAQAKLGRAIDTLAELRGMLSSLNLVAPTRLTDELQRLCESMLAGQVSHAEEASEALTLALIQLPDYLEKVVAGQSVAPLALLPSINDLRVSRGAAPLSEAELLVPTSGLSDFERPAANVRGAAHRIAAAVRPQFHLFLLQWLRDRSRRQGLANLIELFRRFQECFRDGFFFDFFLVAEELVAALLEGRIPEDSKTKALIARIDRVIKPLATDPQAWPEEQARALFLDLLSVMARCKHCSYPEEELLAFYGFGQVARQSRDGARYGADLLAGARDAIETLGVDSSRKSTPIRDGSRLGDTGLNVTVIQPRDPTTAFATSSPGSIEEVPDVSNPLDATPDEQGRDPQAADALVQPLDRATEQGFVEPPPESAPPAALAAPGSASGGLEEGRPRAISPDQKSAMSALGASEADTSRTRVRADLIDHLLSNAGDIGIFCAFLAQQSGAATDRLGELEQTVERLGGQLRKLKKETEARIIHALESDAESLSPELDDFDPLGLDPSSPLQQLSRSLEVSADDLGGLRTLLSDAQSDFARLLKRQARIAGDLQAGLLRLRMVPFARTVPRLHRLVSQTAEQLGKEGKLEVSGPEVELERDIQERVLVPVEHLLRNAVVHGIELPMQRERAGKPPAGVITLSLAKDDNDVVIEVADDGAGLNLEAIRKSALDQGLIAEDAQLADDDITELILRPGFSSVREVSQVAGKGMGLDRVNTEVERLSGSLDWETNPGHGTSFAIRLPLTRAIVEALLVRLGAQVFAIPNAAIEGTSRISRADLEACCRGERRDFSSGGQDFRVVYLNSLLQPRGAPDLGEDPWPPVLLARFGEQRVALHVDHLLGRQRILVKPLGPQRSSLHWISGESILPDGSLVLVLDLLGLMRSTDR